MTPYKQALKDAMEMCANVSGAIFIGQSVKFGGQAMHDTFAGVPEQLKIEFPVAEDLQLGFCTGLSLTGLLPICVYPRFDFLLLAANQLVNHLDKLFPDKRVIIRTAVGSRKGMDAGPQHTQNHSEAFEKMLHNVTVLELHTAAEIINGYELALKRKSSTILVEYAEHYR